MPSRRSLAIEHLKRLYPQQDSESLAEHYARLHYHAREAKLVQVRSNLTQLSMRSSLDPISATLKNAIADLTDLVEDLI